MIGNYTFSNKILQKPKSEKECKLYQTIDEFLKFEKIKNLIVLDIKMASRYLFQLIFNIIK